MSVEGSAWGWYWNRCLLEMSRGFSKIKLVLKSFKNHSYVVNLTLYNIYYLTIIC